MKRIVYCAFLISLAGKTLAFDLRGTHFESAANAASLDPLLLYSVALAESAYGRGEGNISPWPWTLRLPNGAYYATSKESVKAKLQDEIQIHGPRGVLDVGMMQVNLHWHGHRVSSPLDLLDPKTNLSVGAEILREALNSAPGDLELGIGRYHSWRPSSSREYGRRVLGIYQQMKEIQDATVAQGVIYGDE